MHQRLQVGTLPCIVRPMNDSMDGYLSYLKDRLDGIRGFKFSPADHRNALAEFNRALSYARRHGQTVLFAEKKAD